MSTFQLNQRVRITAHHHWAQGASGTVTVHPAGQGTVSRIVPSRQGPLRFYWVEFDEPQRDADGDGPYQGAEIDGLYLEAFAGA